VLILLCVAAGIGGGLLQPWLGVGLGVGIFLGARFGGHYYMRRYSEFEHRTRLTRSGLR
jgi:hypothetical protein